MVLRGGERDVIAFPTPFRPSPLLVIALIAACGVLMFYFHHVVYHPRDIQGPHLLNMEERSCPIEEVCHFPLFYTPTQHHLVYLCLF